jgi:hypothetical protein
VAAKLPAVSVIEPEAVRLIVFVPVSAMLLVSAKSPMMLAVTLPTPLMVLSMVVLAVRLNAKVALFDKVTALVVPKVPVVVALPICSVPPLTDVAPE